jgi:hypothetical protein
VETRMEIPSGPTARHLPVGATSAPGKLTPGSRRADETGLASAPAVVPATSGLASVACVLIDALVAAPAATARI